MTPIEQMRDPDATRESVVAAVSEFKPDCAQWWVYNVSHRRFMLRLYLSPPSDWLMIATFGVQQLSGTPHWNSPSLAFNVEPDPIRDGQMRWCVDDAAAGFSMTCSNLYWGRNVGWNDESGWFTSFADPSGT